MTKLQSLAHTLNTLWADRSTDRGISGGLQHARDGTRPDEDELQEHGERDGAMTGCTALEKKCAFIASVFVKE